MHMQILARSHDLYLSIYMPLHLSAIIQHLTLSVSTALTLFAFNPFALTLPPYIYQREKMEITPRFLLL